MQGSNFNGRRMLINTYISFSLIPKSKLDQRKSYWYIDKRSSNILMDNQSYFSEAVISLRCEKYQVCHKEIKFTSSECWVINFKTCYNYRGSLQTQLKKPCFCSLCSGVSLQVKEYWRTSREMYRVSHRY